MVPIWISIYCVKPYYIALAASDSGYDPDFWREDRAGGTLTSRFDSGTLVNDEQCTQFCGVIQEAIKSQHTVIYSGIFAWAEIPSEVHAAAGVGRRVE